MTRLEDDVRERFASIAAPDIPAPPTSMLRKRAHRIRATRLAATAGVVAVVAAGVGIGVTSATHRAQKTDYAAGVTAVRVHVPGLPTGEAQWQVAQETVAGKRWVAASYLAGDNPCIGFSPSGGWCHTADNDGQLAEYVTDRGEVTAVLGRVPLAARVVVVHLGSETHTVQAVLTPASSRMRLFATFFPSDVGSGPNQALLGVFDAAGSPVHAATPAPPIELANTRSHLSSLPQQQWRYATVDGGYDAVAYRRSDGTGCVTATNLPATAAGHGCLVAAPDTTRVLLHARLSSGWTLLLGDAPISVGTVLEWGPGGMSSAGTTRIPTVNDRVFWAMSVPPGDNSLVASATPDNNCISVVPLTTLLRTA